MIKEGDLVVDEVRQLLGKVMEVTRSGERVFLRPPAGGREWETGIDQCRPAREAELVSADDLKYVEA